MHLLPFFEFIYSRQLVWHKKEILGLMPPWTDDPILQTYKFCCPYRENDSCTKYLIKKIIDTKMCVEEKVFNIIFFRFFNINGFFDYVHVPRHAQGFRMKDCEEDFDLLKRSGVKLFNDAYAISQVPYDKSYRWGDKHIQILMLLEDIGKNIVTITALLQNSKSMEECMDVLKCIKLVGPFLAYQILIDICYIPGFIKHDTSTHVQVGPGARPAIDKLFPAANKYKDSDYQALCRFIFDRQQHQFELLWKEKQKDWLRIYYPTPYNYGPYLSINNIQSCLCEYRKYENLKSNPRARKRYYKRSENGLRRK